MEGLADILVKVLPWLQGVVDYADILVKATPSLGGLSPMMVLSGFWLILFGRDFLYDN